MPYYLGKHAVTHEDGGTDEISIAGLSGTLADPQIANRIATSGSPVAISSTAPIAGQVLTAQGPSTAVWSSSSTGSASGNNPFLTPPLSPSAFDDEFDSGSPDLVVRGWKFVDSIAPSVAMIRDGDVIPYYAFTTTPALQSNPIPAGHYRSTIYGSVLFLQVPGVINKQYLMWKATPAMSATWPNGTITWCRGARYGYGNAGVVDGSISSEVAYTTTGGTVWDEANRLYATNYNNGAAGNNTAFTGRVIAGSESTFGNLSEAGSTGTKYDIVGNYIFASVSGVVTNVRHNSIFVESPVLSGAFWDGGKMNTYALNPTLFTAIGVRMESGNSTFTMPGTTSAPMHYAFDFVRFFQGDITNKWIAG